MEFMKYKGYQGTCEVSVAGNLVFGQLHGIKDLILYEAEAVSGLRQAFEETVDDYLETCAELGKTPDVPNDGWTTEVPTCTGRYWFWGEGCLGALARHFKEDCILKPAMRLVEICERANDGLYADTEPFLSLRVFDKETYWAAGHLGYWKKAELPVAPKDANGLFGEESHEAE